jgi:hypothetical protein
MGILRKAVVATAIVFALPTPPETAGDKTVPPSVSTFAYLAAATDTLADLKGFCQRNPGVCTTAGVVAVHMEAKAKYGAKLIYEWANDAADPQKANPEPMNEAAADPIATGSYKGKRPLPAAAQSTLSLQDLIPEWKGPPKPAAKAKS